MTSVPDNTSGRRSALVRRLGPGLVTGAADDDPSGIATYSQAGAQFGFDMLWTTVLTLPLMVGVQSISARIGRVTGQGLTRNLSQVFPSALVAALVGALFIANTINIGADLSAMGAATQLVVGGPRHLLTIGFAAASLLLQVLVPYHRYARFLKWLTLVLFAYVAVIFTVKIPWGEVALRTFFPRGVSAGWLLLVVAIFGTTISPYLFFWQSSEEVEEEERLGEPPLTAHPADAQGQLERIGLDTLVGMAFSNFIAFCVILSTAVTLHVHGVTDIETADQAALALRPIAGNLAFALFSLGIIGTGLLAVPVLAGSAGYAVSELFGWRSGLERRPKEAKAFYGVILAAVLLGLAVDYSGLNPIRALFWSAVVNGVISVPILAAMMVVARRRALMAEFIATPLQIAAGWLTTAIMSAAVAGMLFFAVAGAS